MAAVNPATNKIYVANRGDGTVTVINGATNRTSTVSVGASPSALAVHSGANQIYVANSADNTVTIIDGASSSSRIINVGKNPNAVAVNPSTNQVYVINSGDNTVTVIDGASYGTATIRVGANPIAMAVNTATNRAYVANAGDNTVTIINGTSYSTSTVRVAATPDAVAVNTTTNKVYVANGKANAVTVIDGLTNNTSSLGVGANPMALAVNPVTNQVYVANKDGTVTVIDEATSVINTVAVGSSPIGVAVNPLNNLVFVPERGAIVVLDGTTNTTVSVKTEMGSVPSGMTVNPSTNRIYVSNGGNGTVTVLHGANGPKAALTLAGDSETVLPSPFCISDPVHLYHDLPDSPPHAFRDAQRRIHLLVASVHNYPFIGNSFDALSQDCNSIYMSHKDPVRENYDYDEWLASPFTSDGMNVFGIVHNQYDVNYTPSSMIWEASLTQVRSTDGGNTFNQLPLPDRLVAAIPAATWPPGPNASPTPGIGDPSNVIQNPGDGAYYVSALYLSGGGGTCLLRSTDLHTWLAWGGSAFSIALDGATDKTCTRVIPVPYSVKSIHYLKTQRIFLAVGTDQGQQVFYATSYDLVHWSNPTDFVSPIGSRLLGPLSLWQPGDPPPQEYPSIIDVDSSDLNFNVIADGDRLYLYLIRWTPYVADAKTGRMTPVGSPREIIRYPVVLTPQAAFLTAAPTFSPFAGAYSSAQTVTISDATSGVSIYYTTDGTTATVNSTPYTGSITVSQNTTLNAVAVAPDSSSAHATAAYSIHAAVPGFSPAPGTYTTTQAVTISDATSGANIYYTTDGTSPTTSSIVYTRPITVSHNTTVKAVAVAPGYSSSAPTVVAYYIQTAVPTFSPVAGTYTTAQTVTISDATSGANIYYTTDGSSPTTASTPYIGPIAVSKNMTLKAVAAAPGYLSSATTASTYYIRTAVPTFSPVAGTYTAAQTVTISDATSGAAIYYTIDGTSPTTSSTPYTGPITVSKSMTLKAVAAAPGYLSSATTAAAYYIRNAVTGISPTPGNYNALQPDIAGGGTPPAASKPLAIHFKPWRCFCRLLADCLPVF